MLLQENVPLVAADHFRLGGPARYFVEAKPGGEVDEAVSLREFEGLSPFLCLAAAATWSSLITDGPGLVLKPAILGTDRLRKRREGRLFDVGAGESWDPSSPMQLAHVPGRMPERNSGQRRGHAGAERRCVRTGSLARPSSRSRSSTEETDRCANCAAKPAASLTAPASSTRPNVDASSSFALCMRSPGGEPHIEICGSKRHFEGRETAPISLKSAKPSAKFAPQRHADRRR